MSRTRIAALALVNWEGMFYERYLLDRHVTALEVSRAPTDEIVDEFAG